MLITVLFDIISKKTKEVILGGCDIDIEVTPEEYQRITDSFETYMFAGMSEDKNLEDICKRCNAEVSKWDNEEPGISKEECRFDYPLEVRIDHAEHIWHAGFDTLANGKLIPTDAKLFKNSDGTYTVRSPFTDE